MTTNPDDPIAPGFDENTGLTKREHFALELFKSRISGRGDHMIGFRDAEVAVTYADALIAALNEPRKEGSK